MFDVNGIVMIKKILNFQKNGEEFNMIKINFDKANQIATKMEVATDFIHHATNRKIIKANRTTLTVHTKALEANEEMIKLTKLFNQTFQETIDNINSVTKEFERTDHDLQLYFNQLSDLSKNISTYRNAKNG